MLGGAGCASWHRGRSYWGEVAVCLDFRKIFLLSRWQFFQVMALLRSARARKQTNKSTIWEGRYAWAVYHYKQLSSQLMLLSCACSTCLTNCMHSSLCSAFYVNDFESWVINTPVHIFLAVAFSDPLLSIVFESYTPEGTNSEMKRKQCIPRGWEIDFYTYLILY